VLEAMANDLPVVARASTAVSETVGDAGVLLDADAPAIDYAAAAWRVTSDATLRDALVARGRERVAEFSPARTRARLLEALAPILRVAV
ncbi:MAG: hypothetical protein QOI55_2539, partial [Actinomycetota bacterium]|nr:hypothetical protein [Actinomycetota bacterium]